MISPHESFTELLDLTKRYLLQEYSISDRLFSEKETYDYFRAYALQNKKAEHAGQVKGNQAVPVCPKVANVPSVPKVPPVANVPPVPKVANVPPTERIKKEENVETSQTSQRPELKLEQPAAAQAADFTELRKIIREKLPQVHLLDHLPDDTEAKALAAGWAKEKQAAQILILSFDEPPKHQLFLANIAKALQMFGFHAIVTNGLKIENKILQSKELKLIVASSAGFYNLPELQKHHREDTRQGRHYIGDQQLLLLSDIGFYLKEPGLKPSLWKALKELLTTT